MAVRFVVGRAGCGKTYRCLEAIRSLLRQDAARATAEVEPSSPQVSFQPTLFPLQSFEAAPSISSPPVTEKLLLIVPEQSSFQMERALIETPDIAAFTRCEVLSFQRLAFRIFAETGADPRRGDQTIGGFGRLMAVRRLVRCERANLHLLGNVADKPGLIPRVVGAIDELMREQVPVDALVEVGESLDASDPLGAAKLKDLARLYQSYLDYLVGDRIDPAQYLTLAAKRLDACRWLTNARVWVDGFAGFTQQEYVLLAEVARRAASVEVTMLVDPDASAIEATELPALSFSLFARAERTLVRLRKELHSRGIEIVEPVRLRHSQSRPSRFAQPELEALEAGFFSGRAIIANKHASKSTNAAKVDGAIACKVADNAACNAIRVVELADRRAEVDAAIAEIQRLTRTGPSPMRYRDIAVIVRDLGSYHDLLSVAMRSQHIPCFIDQRQATTHHPLVELVRGLLAIAADDCRLDAVRAVLKTGLFPIDAHDADLLENYLIAQGVEGYARWLSLWSHTRMFRRRSPKDQLKQWQEAALKRVNELRVEWVEYLSPWMHVAGVESENTNIDIDGTMKCVGADRVIASNHGVVANRARMVVTDGRTWATALFVCLERLKVGQKIERWAQAAATDGQAELADMHRQVWSDFAELLDEFVRAWGSEPMRVQEFRETLETGLAEFSLGLAPPTLDQVLVGSVERSRQPTLRAVLLLGFDESQWPTRRSEDPLLGDAQRQAMRQANVEIGPAREHRLIDERMLAYIAVTRAMQRLWISYPRSENDGKSLQPSPFLAEILQAVPEVRVEKVVDAGRGGDVSLNDLYKSFEYSGVASSVGRLGGSLAMEVRARPRLEQERPSDLERRALLNAVYSGVCERVTRERTACEQPEWRQDLLRSLSGLSYANNSSLSPSLIDRAIKSPLVASVSRLERLAACPFSHYSDYWLRLEPRVEAQTNAIDLGQASHAILELFMAELTSQQQRLADLEDAEIAERVDRIAAKALPALAADLALDDARSEFLLDRSRAHLTRVTRWQRDFARRGQFRPAVVEFAFGYEQDKLVRLRTPKGREVLLRGRIDRVDVAELAGDLLGLIIDYKRTSDRKLNLLHVYHGLSLQLVGYLLALQQAGHTLTGRPIRPIATLYLPLMEPYRTVAHPDEAKKVSYKCLGLIDASVVGAMDEAVQPGSGPSKFISAAINKDGTCNKQTDLVERNELAALVSHVECRMGELADQLLEGDVSITPYRIHRQTPCGYCAYRAVCRFEIETQYPRTLQRIGRREVLQQMAEEGQSKR